MIGLRILERVGLYRPLNHDHKRFERLAKRCNDIERIFWKAGYFELSKWGVMTSQDKVSGYYLDFSLKSKGFKVAIEIDGHEFHKSKEQREADYRRERHLKCCGWRFIRFTGSEVYGDVQSCVEETLSIVREINRKEAI